MPTTAFSKSFGREIDVEQLLRLLQGRPEGNVDTTLADLPPEWRAFIRQDVECPSCFKTGAELVAAGRSKSNGRLVRQACFRFKDDASGEGHHPYCDFYSETGQERQPENLVMFCSPRSEITRVVGELICRGVQLGIFNQRSMRDLRQWFFQKKQSAQFHVTLSPGIVEWIYGLRRYTIQGLFAFNPLHAEIPGFDWGAAARDHLWRQHEDVIEFVRTSRLSVHEDSVRKRAQLLATMYHGKTVFDPSVLKVEYQLTLQLSEFIAQNYAPLLSTRGKLPPPALLAFSALLLFVSQHNMSSAIEKLVAITRQETFDPNAGNFMGLNPFHDYDAWRIIKELQEFGPLSTDSYDVKQQIRSTEACLRQQHALWKQGQQQ